MQSSKNKVVIACAGSGKTTLLVKDAIAPPRRRVAFVTYTNSNLRCIVRRFGEHYGGIPKHVEVMTWLRFLLCDCARPYQHSVYPDRRIESIMPTKGRSPWIYGESNTARHYFCGGDLIYTDKISKFIVRCEDASGGRVVRRLCQVYTDLFIDECQDLAGDDWDLVNLLLRSNIRVTLMGDPCQSILSRNLARKNQRYRRSGVTELLERWEENGLCEIQVVSETRRCSSAICKFVNRLWPVMEGMTSLRTEKSPHDGVFLVGRNDVPAYVRRFKPQVLRHSRRKKAPLYERTAMNFGVAKGTEYDHVLIVPTKPIRDFLKSGDPSVLKAKEKLHVAITRARDSVAFVFDGDSPVVTQRYSG